MKHLLPVLFLTAICTTALVAQTPAPRITGNLQTNGNFFITDAKIGATGTPQYDNQKFGAESWLALNYSNWGFDRGVRFDMFNNSNLLNPTGSFTGEGIGRWYIHKEINKFDVSAGYLYDQIGSGIIFRAYEERALMIDNALFGVKAGYQINDNWKVKAFTGRQKRQFTTYGSVIRGGSIEGFIKPDSTKSLTLAPGFGTVARTLDRESVTRAASEMKRYQRLDSIQYNSYAFTLYNTLSAGNFTWFVEGAFKTKDVIFNEFDNVTTRDTTFLPDGSVGSISLDTINGILVNTNGYMAYTSLTYATGGFGITLEGKYTKNFRFRTDPFQIGVQGQMNFLPPIARQNTFRLPARFAPNTQEIGEQGLQLDARYSLNDKMSVALNVTDIYLLDGKELYREIAPEFTYKHNRKWQALVGLQFLKYNIGAYQFKDDSEDNPDILPWVKIGKKGYVDAFSPYAEWLYKFTPRKSLRVEAQYLLTDDEFGSWTFLLAELGLAPHWLIYVSDMYKIRHSDEALVELEKKGESDKAKYDGLHYPTVGVVYTHRANRFSLAYVKQVEGINCAGGICRYEPTFHGVRLQLSSSF
ncbi:MAG: hypothetical protein IPM98_15915 [Lewinellaceae bacterium]|nr:hypothetical protein [Lewinellaceae bacterium]